MLQAFFHAWERRLASVTTDRVVRPFEWGLDWIPQNRMPRTNRGRRRRWRNAAADVLRDWVSHVMADTDAFFTPPPTTDYRLEPGADGSGNLTFPSALVTPHPDNNTVRCRYFPARNAFERGHGLSPSKTARRRARHAAMERRPWRPCRVVPAARVERDERPAAQPAVSRPADAARTSPRRLHRQRERRADGPGLPPGGPRREAGDCLARVAGLRPHRHSRHEPRLLPRASHDRARTADSGRGAQSHLAAVRRRRVARSVHTPRA